MRISTAPSKPDNLAAGHGAPPCWFTISRLSSPSPVVAWHLPKRRRQTALRVETTKAFRRSVGPSSCLLSR